MKRHEIRSILLSLALFTSCASANQADETTDIYNTTSDTENVDTSTDTAHSEDSDCIEENTVDESNAETSSVPDEIPPGWVLIERGSFSMGYADGDSESRDAPVHDVTITSDFYIMDHEITQTEWLSVFGLTPDSSVDYCSQPLCPVTFVNWYEAISYANTKSMLDGFTPCYDMIACSGTVGRGCDGFDITCDPEEDNYSCVEVALIESCTGYRLPTEAEWEYTARAGTTSRWSHGDEVTQLQQYAWYMANADDSAHTVRTLLPNQYNVFDMHGNVWEWVLDDFCDYTAETQIDPVWINESSIGTIRGGAYNLPAEYVTSNRRNQMNKMYRRMRVGFRLARTYFPTD